MIDPKNITDYNLSDDRLEEYILFCIAVAGKNAITTANNLEYLLGFLGRRFKTVGKPFDSLKALKWSYGYEKLAPLMKAYGFGCYTLKARGFEWICESGLDLKNCTSADLEQCPGIGQKTARFFILHTRANAEVACLDTHILKWLKKKGYDVPKQSPQSQKKYREIEQIFLKECRKRGMSPAEMDLAIWNAEREGREF